MIARAALLTAVLCVLTAPACAEVRVFVTNEKSNDVTVIDPRAGHVIATVPVGQRPRGIAATPDGRLVLIANSNSDSVTTLDAATLSPVRTVPANIDPEGLAVEPNGRVAWTVNENDQKITALDVATGAILTVLPGGTEPETAVVSPDGAWVAVCNETSNDVYLVSTRTRQVESRIAVGKNPRGMRFTGDSRHLYVACEASNALTVIDVSRRSVARTAGTGGVRPVDILITTDGKKLLVSHGGSGDVRIYDAESLMHERTIPVGPRAWWMAMSRTTSHRDPVARPPMTERHNNAAVLASGGRAPRRYATGSLLNRSRCGWSASAPRRRLRSAS